MTAAMLPKDHLERVFGRDMHGNGWEIEVPDAANDDKVYLEVDAAELLKRVRR